VLDNILLAGLVATAKNPKDFVITGEPLRTENQARMYRRDASALKPLIDHVVGGMMQSGEMAKLYRRWFMAPIPPKCATIN
jgi:glutamate/aspartate transport system substrate-binding protein